MNLGYLKGINLSQLIKIYSFFCSHVLLNIVPGSFLPFLSETKIILNTFSNNLNIRINNVRIKISICQNSVSPNIGTLLEGVTILRYLI